MPDYLETVLILTVPFIVIGIPLRPPFHLEHRRKKPAPQTIGGVDRALLD